MLVPTAEALYCWGIFCFGPKVTLTFWGGGLVFCLQGISSLHTVYLLEKGKVSPFYFRGLLSLSLLPQLLGLICFMNVISSTFLSRRQFGKLVVLLHTDLRVTARRERLPSQAGNLNPDYGNLGSCSAFRDVTGE